MRQTDKGFKDSKFGKREKEIEIKQAFRDHPVVGRHSEIHR